MQNISLQKKSFFNSIGLDIHNIPNEIKINAYNMSEKLPADDLKFLSNEQLTKSEPKYFRLKNLIGTDNPDYHNKSWLDILVQNEKSDDIIKQYFKNPNYYFNGLRKLDQTGLSHNCAIELYEDNGKYFVKEGIGRLSLLMTKYLLEMSRADSKEERLMINKQYTFAANVRSIPKDRDIMYLINILSGMFGERLKIIKINDSDSCEYVMELGEKTVNIKTKEDFENFIRNSFFPREYKSLERLKSKVLALTKIGDKYKDDVDAMLVIGRIFPNYEMFVKYFSKIENYDLEYELYDNIELTNVTYDQILKKIIKIVKREENSMKEEIIKRTKKTKKEMKQSEKIEEAKAGEFEKKDSKSDELVTNKKSVSLVKKTVEPKVVVKAANIKSSVKNVDSKVATKTAESKVNTKTTDKQISKDSSKDDSVREKNTELDNIKISHKSKKNTEEDKKFEEEDAQLVQKKDDDKEATKKKELENSKNQIKKNLKSIADNIEMMYYKLKSEESKSIDLANSCQIDFFIDRIEDESVSSSISSIKGYIVEINKKIDEAENFDDIKDLKEFVKDIEKASNNKELVEKYKEELKVIFYKSFNKHVQKLITDAKLKKLDIQREAIEAEKCSFFSKLIGKAKLKQAKLDNINLKKQLIMSESQFSDKLAFYLEDGLSDMYAYVKSEDTEECLIEVRTFMRSIEGNMQIKKYIDQKKLSKLVNEKLEQQRNLPQLSLSHEKRHFFSKAQINLMQEKNNELKRVIQINRANSLKQQNTGLIPILGNIRTKNVAKFYTILNDINVSLKNQV